MDPIVNTPYILLNNLVGVIYISGDTRSNVGVHVAITDSSPTWYAIGWIDIRSRVGEFSLCSHYGGDDIFSN
jgi:hypothetical protein